MASTNTTIANVKLGGLAGEHQYITIVPGYDDPKDPRNAVPPAGQAGPYRVVFTLARRGFPLLPEDQFSMAGALEGDSHILLDSEGIGIAVNAKLPSGLNLRFHGLKNPRGCLGKVEVDLERAEHVTDAEDQAYRAIAPMLGSWSLQLDIPIQIYQVDVLEIGTGVARISMTTPFRETLLTVPPEEWLRPVLAMYGSLYREALNSTSTVYRFLCFFKIIESLYRRRDRLTQEAQQKGKQLRYPREAIPSQADDFLPWLHSVFPAGHEWDDLDLRMIFRPEALGKKIRTLYKGELRVVRNSIAHALLEGGELVASPDDAIPHAEVDKWLPLAKCIVRHLLKTEFPASFPAEPADQAAAVPEGKKRAATCHGADVAEPD